jgi:hypothetical protein
MDADSLDDNSALIGGIVGGVVGLLLIGGLIAFLVVRSRRTAAGNGEANNGAALQSKNGMRDAGAAQHRNDTNYAALPPENEYGVVGVAPPHNYDAWSDKGHNYAKPSPNGTDYEDFTKVH